MVLLLSALNKTEVSSLGGYCQINDATNTVQAFEVRLVPINILLGY
jgi:hypothetical protein